MPFPKSKSIIICTDAPGDGYFSTGSTIDEAYENYCAYHRSVDIRKLFFFSAIEIPEKEIPQGEDYD